MQPDEHNDSTRGSASAARRATATDVARLAGVSQAVVSKVLNHTRGNIHVGEETARRVEKAAAKCGYRRNRAAAATRSGRFGSIALILSAAGGGRSSLPEELLDPLASALEDRGMHLTVAVLPDVELTSEDFVPRFLREWACDGLLVNYNKEIPARLVRELEEHTVPSVWLNCKRTHDCVYPDDFAGGRQATERLLALGHRGIDYASYSYNTAAVHYSEPDRLAGYAAAMRAAGLPVRSHTPALETSPPDRLGHARSLLQKADRPTAVVTYGNTTAMPILLAAAEVGIRVPDELSIITFDNSPTHVGRSISTMVVPCADTARTAVDMLLAAVESGSSNVRPEAVSYTEFSGNTCARIAVAEEAGK